VCETWREEDLETLRKFQLCRCRLLIDISSDGLGGEDNTGCRAACREACNIGSSGEEVPDIIRARNTKLDYK